MMETKTNPGVSFYGLYFNPPLSEADARIVMSGKKHTISGLRITDFKLAMKEIASSVAAAGREDGKEYIGTILKYEGCDSKEETARLYFVHDVTEFMHRSAALLLIRHAEAFPFNNWLTSEVKPYGNYLKERLEKFPDAQAFIVEGDRHQIFPLGADDIAVEVKKKRCLIYYPKAMR